MRSYSISTQGTNDPKVRAKYLARVYTLILSWPCSEDVTEEPGLESISQIVSDE